MARFNALKMQELRDFIKENSDLNAKDTATAWNKVHPDEQINAQKIYQLVSRDKLAGKSSQKTNKKENKNPLFIAVESTPGEDYTFDGLLKRIEWAGDYAKKLREAQAEKAKQFFLA